MTLERRLSELTMKQSTFTNCVAGLLPALLLLAFTLPAQAAGVFDGSTSDLVRIESATPIEYPVLMACMYRADDATHHGTLLALSDNGAGGSLDSLALEIRGDVGGDPLAATSTAAGVSSSATTTFSTILASSNEKVYWYTCAYFESPTSRRIYDWSASGNATEETTSRAVGDWTHLSIGALYDGGATNRFKGAIIYAGVWFGVGITDGYPFSSHTIQGLNRSNLPGDPTKAFLRQKLIRKANDYYDWGPDVTNNGVTFDFRPYR